MTFWHLLLWCATGTAVVVAVFLFWTMVLGHLQLAELKLGSGLVLVAAATAVAGFLWGGLSVPRSIAYAVGAQFLVTGVLAAVMFAVAALRLLAERREAASRALRRNGSGRSTDSERNGRAT